MTSAAIEQLPEPSPDAAAHGLRLVDHIRIAIEAAGGSISFADYMNLALYAPGLGYYSAGTQKFGAAGDFVTAPEVSPLFSRCYARQIAELMRELNLNEILELGAGSGVMAAEILKELHALKCPPRRYAILEISAELKERQQQTIKTRAPDFLQDVQWLDELPQNFAGIIIGNEVLDAFPVERFRLSSGEIHQVTVTWADGRLVESSRPATNELAEKITATLPCALDAFGDAYESELNLRIAPFIASLDEALSKGVVLFADYGMSRDEYYHPQRRSGTLMCHYRHRAHADPFVYPGLQDITAYVDFTSVAEAGVAAGFNLLGYTTQAQFLLAMGIDTLLQEAAAKGGREYLELTRQVKLLTLPGEMGERFKIIALGKGVDCVMRCFSMRDLSGML